MEYVDIDKILNKITEDCYIAFELDISGKICISKQLKDKIIFV